MNLLGIPGSSISLVKNPFHSDKIISVSMNCYPKFRQPGWTGSITFQNDMTEGTQKFEVKGAENLPILLQQMQDFVNSLK